MTNLSVWVCLSKTGNVLVFDNEPDMKNGEWFGNPYINSSMYAQIEKMIKQSNMTPKSLPEQIVFTVMEDKN